MQGLVESLVSIVVARGFGPALFAVLMAAPAKKVVRAQLKKIYVLNEHGEMAGEYILDPDCPIDYNDFLKVLPADGIGDRDSLFVGEYVFTAFQSGKFVFVLLSRGQLSSEDFDWTALLLTAADSHLATSTTRPAGPRPAESMTEPDADLAARESRITAREKNVAELEAKLKAETANLAGRSEELERQKQRLKALAGYTSEMMNAVTKGVSRATKTLEMAEQVAALSRTESVREDASAIQELRQRFEAERAALLSAKSDLEAKYREASARIATLERESKSAIATLERERAEAQARLAEEEKTRREIETRVAELGQRFAAMAKERLLASHRPPEPLDADNKALEATKAELAREKRFLQRRAIELLDREERLRDRETKLEETERDLARRAQELAGERAAFEQQKQFLAEAKPSVARAEADEARKDIERRVKIIQQKALELLDREEKLRKRAAELEAMEARLEGRVPAR